MRTYQHFSVVEASPGKGARYSIYDGRLQAKTLSPDLSTSAAQVLTTSERLNTGFAIRACSSAASRSYTPPSGLAPSVLSGARASAKLSAFWANFWINDDIIGNRRSRESRVSSRSVTQDVLLGGLIQKRRFYRGDRWGSIRRFLYLASRAPGSSGADSGK